MGLSAPGVATRDGALREGQRVLWYSDHARRPPGAVPFNNARTTNAAVRAQPSHETGERPQPLRRGPNHAFLPTMGVVRTGE